MSTEPFLNWDVVNRLPPNIQAILKRKSSRDPNSRFTSKLRVLLDFATNYPRFENDIGLSWVDEETFRINKRALAGVMGVKVNTLNVNLRDLHFEQQNPPKDGWTTWKKEGFTRNSGRPPMDEILPSIPDFAAQIAFPRIGKVRPETEALFLESARVLWQELVDNFSLTLGAETFLKKAAAKFKTEQQATQNAVDVLRAIICPSNELVVSEVQFVRFMAMFGPASTAMLKISSLLEISHTTGQWLIFDPATAPPGTSAAFDGTEANCLVIRRGVSATRVWNLPLVDARADYVVDERGKYYSSWKDYFVQHPANGGPLYDGLFLTE
jgi:hypothetical protein